MEEDGGLFYQIRYAKVDWKLEWNEEKSESERKRDT